MKTSKHRIAGWLLALLLTGVGAWAQAPEEPLTLSAALQYALQHQSDVKKAKLDEENANYQIEEVRSRALPQLTGTGGLTYNPILQMSAVPGDLAGQPGTTLLIAFGQKWNASTAIALSQNLFDKSVFTGLKAAKTTKEFFKIRATLTDEQIIEQVATSYYQVLVQRQKIAVVDSTIASATRVLEVIDGLYKNGLAKKIDVDRTRVNISNLQTQRQQLTNVVQIQENTLKFFMGMDITTPINIPAPEFTEIQPNMELIRETPVVTNMTDYQLLKTQEKLLHYQKESVKAAAFPTLSLNGNYGYQGLGNTLPIGKGPSQNVNWFDWAAVGVTLRIPIFTGFGNRARIKQADIEVRKVQEDLQKQELALNLAYENAKAQLINALTTLNNQLENVELAREVYNNTRNNYDQGLAPLTDLLDAETSLTTTQNNYSTALLDYRLAEIQVIKTQGKLKSLVN
ncbi:MAG TPA: TolC family protein [Flavihumibacter sp.]|jgi:outer membrane protein